MEKQLVPKLRFSEFKGDWKSLKIGNIGKPSMCKRIMKDQTLNVGDIPFYKIGTFGKEADAYISNDLYEEYKTKFSFPKKGDILISASGTIGRTVIYDGKPAYFQDSNIVWIANNEEKVLNKLLVYLYENVRWTTENTTIARLYNDNLKSINITIPSLPEQQKIASFLTDVDNKITKLTKKKELLEQYKKGIMQKIFNQELRFKDDNGNAFPKWEVKKLGDVCKIQSSKRVLQEDWTDKGVPFYRTREIISLSESKEFRTPIFITEKMYNELVKKYGVPKENDILVTGVGTIGKTYIVKKDEKFYFKDGNVLWIKTDNQINSEFLHQQFNTRFIRKQLSDNASITTVATFTIDGARNTMIKIPSKEEQTKIANFLSDIDIKIEALNTKIENSITFKKGLLQQMFV